MWDLTRGSLNEKLTSLWTKAMRGPRDALFSFRVYCASLLNSIEFKKKNTRAFLALMLD